MTNVERGRQEARPGGCLNCGEGSAQVRARTCMRTNTHVHAHARPQAHAFECKSCLFLGLVTHLLASAVIRRMFGAVCRQLSRANSCSSCTLLHACHLIVTHALGIEGATSAKGWSCTQSNGQYARARTQHMDMAFSKPGHHELGCCRRSAELSACACACMQVEAIEGCCVLAAVGQGMVNTKGVSATMMGALAKANVNIKAIAQVRPRAAQVGSARACARVQERACERACVRGSIWRGWATVVGGR